MSDLRPPEDWPGGDPPSKIQEKNSMKISRLLTCVIATTAMATPAGAGLSYSVGGWSQQFSASTTPPANAPWGTNGYPGDTVALQAYSGVLGGAGALAPGSYTEKVNTLLWTIDYTYGGTATDPNAWSDLDFTFNALRSMTIGGVGGSITQGGQLQATWDNDFLSLSDGPSVTFIVDGFQIDVTVLGLAQVGGSNFAGGNPWVQPNRDVMARFDVTAVPVPGAVVLGGLGLGALGWMKRRFAI